MQAAYQIFYFLKEGEFVTIEHLTFGVILSQFHFILFPTPELVELLQMAGSKMARPEPVIWMSFL